ncbi:MAG: ATPase domain-containing protein [Gemmatimonadaceae bacterium]
MPFKVKIKSLSTGVPGLDDVLGGGLPELSFNLIAGPPGCGKTTLALQMMFHMATPERPALYISVLGEPPLKMLRYQQQFDFFDSDMVNRSVHFMSLTDQTLMGDLDQVLQHIAAEVKRLSAAYVILDSFRALVRSSKDDDGASDGLPRFMQQLTMVMNSWQATTILIGEYAAETDANPVFAVADGLIWLRQVVLRNSMVRKLEVLKMRGQASLAGLYSFRISTAGIRVFAPARIPIQAAGTETLAGPLSRVSVGVPMLDQMLGGGLPRGYSLLVAGPSGSGKSVLATAFLEEGAKCGETGVLATFEPGPLPSRNAVLADLYKEGNLGVVDGRGADLSVDEILHLLMAEIRARKAQRVVIDSLSGFELSLAPTYREDFREEMSRLANALASTGVTILMTSELEDRYIDLRFSPYGTAFLTDAIVVQRYIELDSRLRRVMAVVKVRASAHSNELREFSVEDGIIRVGEMLPAEEGLLGGRPTRKRASDLPAAVAH